MPNTQRELAFLAQHHDIHIGARGFIEDGRNLDANGALIPSNYGIIARDSALVTQPNASVPVALLSYWDPKAIEVLTTKRAATEIFHEAKKGNFASQQINFRMDEITGDVAPYSDFGQSGETSTNYNWPFREVYRFQTLINVGDLEAEMSGEAKISLVADKQRAAATNIAIAHNKFYLYGVEGKQIFGLLNDPSLLSAIVPEEGASESTAWESKTTAEIYEDVITLFSELVTQMGGNVDQSMPLTLAVSPSCSVQLGKATDFNVSVLDMLNKFFKSLKIVIVPELTDDAGDMTIYMKADNVMGQKTGECVAPEKFRSYPVFKNLSSIQQKVAAATAGAILYRPAAIATMTGV